MNFKAQIILTLSKEFSRHVMSKSNDENADVIFNILQSVTLCTGISDVEMYTLVEFPLGMGHCHPLCC